MFDSLLLKKRLLMVQRQTDDRIKVSAVGCDIVMIGDTRPASVCEQASEFLVQGLRVIEAFAGHGLLFADLGHELGRTDGGDDLLELPVEFRVVDEKVFFAIKMRVDI